MMVSGRGSTKWVWRNPAQSGAWITRVAALLLALPCLANMLLIRVAFDKGYFQWTISAMALIAATLLFLRAFYGRQTFLAGYGALIAAGMWAANTMEIALAEGVRTEGKLRNGGFYAGYAFLSGLFYLAERVGYHTDPAPVTKAVEIVDYVVDQVGTPDQVVSVVHGIDAQMVADAVVEESDILISNENGNGNGGHQNGRG
jgi:hypothetical protein